MRVAIDNARHDVLVGAIDHPSVCRSFQPFAHSSDLAVANQDVSISQHAVSDREYRRISDQRFAWIGSGCLSASYTQRQRADE